VSAERRDVDSFQAARDVIAGGIATLAYPAAVVNVGRSSGVIWQEAFGRLSYADSAPPCTLTTIFDLASLTKVISTASIAMKLVDDGRLALDSPVTAILQDWTETQWKSVSVRHLLDHSSGLPAHLRLWQSARSRDEFAAAIRNAPLERTPGSASVYSDPGFLVLGWILERAGGQSLDRLFEKVFGRGPEPLLFRPQAPLFERIAPTENDPWRGRVLCGEVHDENAAALGGVAPHAGLFGTAEAVGAFARKVLATFKSPTSLATTATMELFSRKTGVPNSSRALAWDTALPTSSSGAKMRPTAIGHTGFTGTSLWIDRERDCYAVLLTNRVHPTRANEKLVPLRAVFHDALPF